MSSTCNNVPHSRATGKRLQRSVALLAVGGSATAVHYGTMFVILFFFHVFIPTTVAAAMSALIGFTLAGLLTIKMVYQQRLTAATVWSFSQSAGLGLLVNIGVSTGLLHSVFASIWIAQIIGTCCGFVATFVNNERIFIAAHGKKHESDE
jgi:putative flippase GtrA